MDSNTFPRARRADLKVQAVDDELLLFDTVNETAHALNGPAAFVWSQADGTRTIEQLASAMTRRFGTPADPQVVWYALGQLQRRELLEAPEVLPVQMRGMTRRQFLTRAAAGATLLAVVTSILTPSPAHAQSACLEEGALCIDIRIPCCGDLGCCVGLGATCQSFC